jgi:uncharacterized protein YjbJ (UPF0337 family)
MSLDMESMSNNWNELKSKIRTKWNKLTDSDVDSFNEDPERIPTGLQSRYGYSKDEADREYKDWRRTLAPDSNSGGDSVGATSPMSSNLNSFGQSPGTVNELDAHGGDRLN